MSKRNDGAISAKNVRTVGGKTELAAAATKSATRCCRPKAAGGGSVGKTENKPRGSPSAAAQRRAYFSKKPPQSMVGKKYKVLNNGVVGKNELTKKKIRVISSKKAAKLKKAKLKKLKKQQKKFMREQSQLIGIAMYGFAPPKKTDVAKTVTNVKKAANIVGKPVETLKRSFYSRADKSDDNGVKAAKLGMQIKDYGTSGLKTAAETGVKTAKNGSKIAKRVYRKIHNAVMHLDEATPHLHIDFVPITHKVKSGLSVKVSMKGALKEQGFSSANKKQNEWSAWEERERDVMIDILRKHDLGHSSVEITLNRYVHSSMERKAQYMKSLSALFTVA